jgi:hypothetical protein
VTGERLGRKPQEFKRARDAVTVRLAREIREQFAASHGRAADDAETAGIARFAAFVTRGGTEAGPFDAAAAC